MEWKDIKSIKIGSIKESAQVIHLNLEAIALLKPATNLDNDKPALISEWLGVENKPTTLLTWVVPEASNYATHYISSNTTKVNVSA